MATTEHPIRSQNRPALQPKTIMPEEDLLDAFDFDVNMQNIIDADHHGRLLADTPASSDAAAADDSAAPFVLGNYLEKCFEFTPGGRFLVQDTLTGSWNEIGGDTDEATMKKTSQAFQYDSGIVKYSLIKDHTAMAAFVPEDVDIMAIKKQENKKGTKRVLTPDNAVNDARSAIPPCMVVIQENDIMDLLKEDIGEWEPNCTPQVKKQKLGGTAPSITTRVLKMAQFDWKSLEEKLTVILRDHSMITNTKTPTSTSRYNGVSKRKLDKRGGKYEAKFSKFRLGSYALEVDAALAYDRLVIASGRENHFLKINFSREQDYISAREAELKAKGMTKDLEESLAYVLAKVNEATSQFPRV